INSASASGPLGNSANAVVLSGTLEYTGTGATPSSTKPFTMSGTGTFQVTNSGTALTLSGIIGGSGALTKTGTGKLALSGANTFSGALTVSAGTLSIPSINNASASGPLGNSANAVVLGGTLEYTGTDATPSSTKLFTMTGTGTFQVDNSGTTLTISGGTVSVTNVTSSGVVQLGTGGITFTNGGTLLNTGPGAQSTSRAITLNTD